MKQVKFITSMRVAALGVPDDFGEGEIGPVADVGRGINKPRVHQLGKSKYITKSDVDSVAFEPLTHDLGKEFKVNVPRTTRRMLPDREGNIVPHSVQEMVHGYTGGEIQKAQGVKAQNMKTIPAKLRSHPDVHKMVLLDELLKQPDRHTNNFMHDEETDKVHAIDNGYAMAGYHPNISGALPKGAVAYDRSKENLHAVDGPIPADFRQAVLNANPDHHAGIIDKHMPHIEKALTARGLPYPEVIQDEYRDRLMKFKQLMANPKIQTMAHFRQALYPQK